MVCCGEERSTRFCPDCGAKLTADATLMDLMAHCRAQAKRQAKREETLSPREKAFPRKGIVASAKWREWADALEKLLAESRFRGEGEGPR